MALEELEPQLPRFTGSAPPASWIGQAELFFQFYSIYGDERFSYVIDVFEDEPFYWFNSWFRSDDLTWADFTIAMFHRFVDGARVNQIWLCPQFTSHCPSRKDQSVSYEVIIVVDGSKDGSQRVAFDFVRKYKVDNVRVILQRKNQGKGEAIKKGMLRSRGELLLMLDADGANKVDDLEKLENQLVLVNPVGEVMEKLQKSDGDDILQQNTLFLTVGEVVSSLFSSMKSVSSGHV